MDVCFKGVIPMIIFAQTTMDHAEYIHNVLSIVRKYEHKATGAHWIFQQANTRLHAHHK